MIIFGEVEGFQWDFGNIHKNLLKHNVSQAEAEQIFFNEPLIVLADGRHSQRETRFHALGRTNNNRLLQVSFTVREGNAKFLRVISARPMSRKERKAYAEKT